MEKLKAWFQRFCLWAGTHPLLCALLFFALSVAVRMAVNYRLGVIITDYLPDESLFLHLARSIASGGELLVMGQPTNFQKLLYPLLIAPAFALLKDPIVQLRLVVIINVITMSSAVFPAALLVKRLSQKGKALLLTLAAVICMPEFLHTAEILSEPLYLPLCLWAFYLFLRAMEETGRAKRPLLFALFGFVLYLVYFTKEVALVFVLAAAGILIFEGIRDRRDKGKLAQNGLSLLALALSFFALFLVLKLTLFRGQGSLYTTNGGSFGARDQVSLSALFSLKAILYLPYSAAVQLTATLLSFCVLPVLLPLFGFKSLSEQKKRLYLFLASSLVIMAATVAYTISIREDLWQLVPRLHTRYFFPLAVPYMALCFDYLLSENKAIQSRRKAKRSQASQNAAELLGRKTVIAITVCVCALLMLLVPTSPKNNAPSDHFSLGGIDLAGFLNLFGMDVGSAYLAWNFFKLALIVLLAVSVGLLFRRRKPAVLAVLCCLVLAVSVYNNSSGFQSIKLNRRSPQAYRIGTENVVKNILLDGELPNESEPLARAAIEVCRYIENLDGVIVCSMVKYWELLETYISPHAPYLSRVIAERIKTLQGSEFSSSEIYGFEVSYIVVTNDLNPFVNTEVVYESEPYIVLRNLDPTRLLLNPN